MPFGAVEEKQGTTVSRNLSIQECARQISRLVSRGRKTLWDSLESLEIQMKAFRKSMDDCRKARHDLWRASKAHEEGRRYRLVPCISGNILPMDTVSAVRMTSKRLVEKLDYARLCLVSAYGVVATGFQAQMPEAIMANRVPSPRIAEELLAMDKDFSNVRFDPVKREIRADTERIVLKHQKVQVDFGEFQIVFRWPSHPEGVDKEGCERFFTAKALQPHCAASNPTASHPHVFGVEICMGDGIQPIRNAFLEGRICDAFLLVRQILRTYNPGGPYVPLEKWDNEENEEEGDPEEQMCPACEEHSSGEFVRCRACGDHVCDDCISRCGSCRNQICGGCSDTCENGDCGETVCSDCRVRCGSCDNSYCSRDSVVDNHRPSGCAAACPECDKTVCNDEYCLPACAGCGKLLCTDCLTKPHYEVVTSNRWFCGECLEDCAMCSKPSGKIDRVDGACPGCRGSSNPTTTEVYDGVRSTDAGGEGRLAEAQEPAGVSPAADQLVGPRPARADFLEALANTRADDPSLSVTPCRRDDGCITCDARRERQRLNSLAGAAPAGGGEGAGEDQGEAQGPVARQPEEACAAVQPEGVAEAAVPAPQG